MYYVKFRYKLYENMHKIYSRRLKSRVIKRFGSSQESPINKITEPGITHSASGTRYL